MYASNPISSLARLTSKQRRGWPSGCARVKANIATKADLVRDQATQLGDGDFASTADIDWVRRLQPFRNELDSTSGIRE